MVGSIAESLIGSLLGSPLPREAAPARLSPSSTTPPASPADSTSPVFPSIPVRPSDRAEISNEARRAVAELEALRSPSDASAAPGEAVPRAAATEETVSAHPPHGVEAATPEEQEEIAKLRDRDHEVRAHEQAHKAAAGAHAGAIHYDYQTGPDGKRYAVGGHVPIDVSPVPDDPQATIQKMDQIRRAALAPAEPSAADRQVAATAARQRAEAQVELRSERTEEALGAESGSDAPASDFSVGGTPASASDVPPEGFTLAAATSGAPATDRTTGESARGAARPSNPYSGSAAAEDSRTLIGSQIDARG